MITPDHWQGLQNLPFPGNVPTPESVQRLYDELDFQRAVQVYLWALPAMNLAAMREGLASTFGAGNNVLAIWKDRPNAQTIFTTANPDVIYALAFVDLKDGPIVVEAPPKLQGLFDDAWHRPLCDIGAAGPDHGAGGKFLLVPPDYEGELPKTGFFVQPSPTYSVFVFLRGFLDEGKTSPAVALLEQTRIYPYGAQDGAPALETPNASVVPCDMDFTRDVRYFEMLARLLDHEPSDREDRAMAGMAAAIGVGKGIPFAPDPRMRSILNAAANIAYKIATTVSFDGRDPKLKLWSGRGWETVFLGGSPEFRTDAWLLWDAMIGFFHKCFSTSAGMVVAMPGKGAQYIMGYCDSEGRHLMGQNRYKLHVQADVPAENYWALTYYDADTRSLLDNGQPFPSVASNSNLKRNPDGTADVFFGPTAPENPDANWIKTLPDRAFFGGFRLYSPSQAYFDGKWVPNDPVKID